MPSRFQSGPGTVGSSVAPTMTAGGVAISRPDGSLALSRMSRIRLMSSRLPGTS